MAKDENIELGRGGINKTDGSNSKKSIISDRAVPLNRSAPDCQDPFLILLLE